MPIMQWLYFDALECLAEEEGVVLTEEECAPVGVQSKFHTNDEGGYTLWCQTMVLNLFICLFLFFSPRGTVDTTGRLQCLAPSCRIYLANSATSW